jgi:hypothetical protein
MGTIIGTSMATGSDSGGSGSPLLIERNTDIQFEKASGTGGWIENDGATTGTGEATFPTVNGWLTLTPGVSGITSGMNIAFTINVTDLGGSTMQLWNHNDTVQYADITSTGIHTGTFTSVGNNLLLYPASGGSTAAVAYLYLKEII